MRVLYAVVRGTISALFALSFVSPALADPVDDPEKPMGQVEQPRQIVAPLPVGGVFVPVVVPLPTPHYGQVVETEAPPPPARVMPRIPSLGSLFSTVHGRESPYTVTGPSTCRLEERGGVRDDVDARLQGESYPWVGC